jgi:hypothetical protein
MTRTLIGTALAAVLGLIPAIGSACEYNDVTMASSTPPAQLGLAAPPAASKAPAPVVAKAPAVKQAGDKATSPAPQAKVAAVVARTN